VCRSRRSATAEPLNSAERRAARWYRLRGWRIVGANVWAGGNEVDLIARRGPELRFVEVKEKTGPAFGEPAEMVGAEKQRRVRRASELWLAGRPDLAELRVPSTSSPCTRAGCGGFRTLFSRRR